MPRGPQPDHASGEPVAHVSWQVRGRDRRRTVGGVSVSHAPGQGQVQEHGSDLSAPCCVLSCSPDPFMSSVVLRGALDARDAQPLETVLGDVCGVSRRVLVDLTAVTRVDGAVMIVLVGAHHRLEKKDGFLMLVNPSRFATALLRSMPAAPTSPVFSVGPTALAVALRRASGRGRDGCLHHAAGRLGLPDCPCQRPHRRLGAVDANHDSWDSASIVCQADLQTIPFHRDTGDSVQLGPTGPGHGAPCIAADAGQLAGAMSTPI